MFICALFNDAVSNSDDMESNDMLINERIRKETVLA
jgi:hypothetical protein